MQLSTSDRNLLNLLQADASRTRNELAELAGMSSSTLWRKIQEFEASGLIRKRVALLDPDLAELSVCAFVFINLLNHAPETRADFEKFISRTPSIMESYSVTGAHDYTLITRQGSVEAFEHLLMNEILRHPSVSSVTSQFALRCQKYSTELPL